MQFKTLFKIICFLNESMQNQTWKSLVNIYLV